MIEPPFLTDDEIREICDGLTQPGAMVRYLREELGIPVVRRKPNGMPLVGRGAFRVAMGEAAPTVTPLRQKPNRERLRALQGGRA